MQADLRLCWLHIPHCWKSHGAAQIVKTQVDCHIMGHFSSNCNVCLDKNNFQGQKSILALKYLPVSLISTKNHPTTVTVVYCFKANGRIHQYTKS